MVDFMEQELPGDAAGHCADAHGWLEELRDVLDRPVGIFNRGQRLARDRPLPVPRGEKRLQFWQLLVVERVMLRQVSPSAEAVHVAKLRGRDMDERRLDRPLADRELLRVYCGRLLPDPPQDCLSGFDKVVEEVHEVYA